MQFWATRWANTDFAMKCKNVSRGQFSKIELNIIKNINARERNDRATLKLINTNLKQCKLKCNFGQQNEPIRTLLLTAKIFLVISLVG